MSPRFLCLLAESLPQLPSRPGKAMFLLNNSVKIREKDEQDFEIFINETHLGDKTPLKQLSCHLYTRVKLIRNLLWCGLVLGFHC